MFIKLRNTRININNICSYRLESSIAYERFVLWICFGSDEQAFCFRTEQELNKIVEKLDKITKVK